jgi:hypothetical protein
LDIEGKDVSIPEGSTAFRQTLQLPFSGQRTATLSNSILRRDLYRLSLGSFPYQLFVLNHCGSFYEDIKEI